MKIWEWQSPDGSKNKSFEVKNVSISSGFVDGKEILNVTFVPIGETYAKNSITLSCDEAMKLGKLLIEAAEKRAPMLKEEVSFFLFGKRV